MYNDDNVMKSYGTNNGCIAYTSV